MDTPGVGEPAARVQRRRGLVKRSFSLAGHRTSVALEDEFWSALDHIAAARGRTVSALVMDVDAERAGFRPLASELRVFALTWFRGSATDR
jgi:predicted DNA-binding ribbon-helix-helix protein